MPYEKIYTPLKRGGDVEPLRDPAITDEKMHKKKIKKIKKSL